MHILIIHSGEIGESLLITPVIRALKNKLGAHISLLIPKDQHVLFQDNPHCDELINADEPMGVIRKQLKSEAFDWVIDLDQTFKSFVCRLGLSGKKLVLQKHRLKRWIYIKTKINLLPKSHVITQYFDLVAPLNVTEDEEGLDLYIPEKDEVEREWLPESHQNGYAAVVIGGSYATRKLPNIRLIELCDRINKPIVLLGDDADLEVAEEVTKFFERGTKAEEEEIKDLNKKAIVFNAVGKFNFYQRASLLQEAAWVFSTDHELMYVAAALKKKIYSIWGNTTPLLGYYPYGTSFTVFENNKLNCRPCTHRGYSNCPKGHFKCMNDLTFDFYLLDD